MKTKFRNFILEFQHQADERASKVKRLSRKEYNKLCEIWTKVTKDILIEVIGDCSLIELDEFIAAFFKICERREEKGSPFFPPSKKFQKAPPKLNEKED